MKLFLQLVTMTGLLASTACRKEEYPIAPVPPPTKAPAAQSATSGADVVAAPYTPDVAGTALGPYQADLASTSPEAQLRGLNGVLSFWLATGRPFPQDLEQFVAAKLLPRLPTPPAGRSFALDPVGRRIVFGR